LLFFLRGSAPPRGLFPPARIGIGPSAISMMLNRQYRPQRRTVAKFAKALKVATSYVEFASANRLFIVLVGQ